METTVWPEVSGLQHRRVLGSLRDFDEKQEELNGQNRGGIIHFVGCTQRREYFTHEAQEDN